jgi:hypothetical protein
VKRNGLASALVGSFAGAAVYFSGIIPEDRIPVFVLGALALGAMAFRGRHGD